jgi:hypothetical protein
MGGTGGIEMKPGADGFVIVAGSASAAGRKGKGVGFGRDDRLVELVLERKEMDWCGPVPIPLLLLPRRYRWGEY